MIESNHQTKKTNGTNSEMSLFLETIHEHALAIDLAMRMIILLVQAIIYPSFRHIDSDRFSNWHSSYCNRISYFVLPLMTLQLIECISSCFFVGAVSDWIRSGCILSAWLVTFMHSAPKHRNLSLRGKDLSVIESLIRGNWFRTGCWSSAFILSFVSY